MKPEDTTIGVFVIALVTFGTTVIFFSRFPYIMLQLWNSAMQIGQHIK